MSELRKTPHLRGERDSKHLVGEWRAARRRHGRLRRGFQRRPQLVVVPETDLGICSINNKTTNLSSQDTGQKTVTLTLWLELGWAAAHTSPRPPARSDNSRSWSSCQTWNCKEQEETNQFKEDIKNRDNIKKLWDNTIFLCSLKQFGWKSSLNFHQMSPEPHSQDYIPFFKIIYPFNFLSLMLFPGN